MLIEYSDFNNAASVVNNRFLSLWEELENVLTKMPLHLKASDQKGKQGKPIFDVVGTNEYIQQHLRLLNWQKVLIPSQYVFLGQHLDFGKAGVIVEVQFSNYPFLLNNVVRSELFFNAKLLLTGQQTGLIVIITKAHMFQASQSTLYYEQAVRQITALTQNDVFRIPIRLVGLFEKQNASVQAKWTTYENPRYSRTVKTRIDQLCRITAGRLDKHRCIITFTKE